MCRGMTMPFIDRALYLPKEWTDEPARPKAAHAPGDVGFAAKPEIARRMIARAIAAKVPFSFVAADSVYGTGEVETLLRKAGKGYVLGVASNHVFRSRGKQQPVAGTASAIARSRPKKARRSLLSGEGTKGPRRHDWAYLELADLEASEYNDDLAGEWTRGLLMRRNIRATQKMAIMPSHLTKIILIAFFKGKSLSFDIWRLECR